MGNKATFNQKYSFICKKRFKFGWSPFIERLLGEHCTAFSASAVLRIQETKTAQQDILVWAKKKEMVQWCNVKKHVAQNFHRWFS